MADRGLLQALLNEEFASSSEPFVSRRDLNECVKHCKSSELIYYRVVGRGFDIREYAKGIGLVQ